MNNANKNMTLKAGLHSEAPWRLKQTGAERWIIEDISGVEICRFTTFGNPNMTKQQYFQNMAVMTHAPRLLAALKEAAAINLEQQGHIHPNLRMLLEDAQNSVAVNVPTSAE
tara:strand:+ start:677 stop:1012 length:336 start_codon:yes stop_codon:yes gene_type:complete